jgi:hypothetical protein
MHEALLQRHGCGFERTPTDECLIEQSSTLIGIAHGQREALQSLGELAAGGFVTLLHCGAPSGDLLQD